MGQPFEVGPCPKEPSKGTSGLMIVRCADLTMPLAHLQSEWGLALPRSTAAPGLPAAELAPPTLPGACRCVASFCDRSS